MKKTRIAAILVLSLLLVLGISACNKQIIDTTYVFDRAIVSLPDGKIVEGKVESWRDYADGDQIQVKIDGVVYLVHSSKIALIND